MVQTGRPFAAFDDSGSDPPETVAVDARGFRHFRRRQLDRTQTAGTTARRLHRFRVIPIPGNPT